MERSRISLARLMMIMIIIALDFWLMRITRRPVLPPWDTGAMTLVPCLEIAAIMAFRRGSRARPFWLGFLISGSLVLLLYSGVRGPFYRVFEILPEYCYLALLAKGIDILEITAEYGSIATDTISTIYGIVLMGIPLVLIPTLVGVLTHFIAARLAGKSSNLP